MGLIARLNGHIRLAANEGNWNGVHILTALRNDLIRISKRYGQEF